MDPQGTPVSTVSPSTGTPSRRGARIVLDLAHADYERLVGACAAASVSVASWTRACLLDTPIIRLPNPADREALTLTSLAITRLARLITVFGRLGIPLTLAATRIPVHTDAMRTPVRCLGDTLVALGSTLRVVRSSLEQAPPDVLDAPWKPAPVRSPPKPFHRMPLSLSKAEYETFAAMDHGDRSVRGDAHHRCLRRLPSPSQPRSSPALVQALGQTADYLGACLGAAMKDGAAEALGTPEIGEALDGLNQMIRNGKGKKQGGRGTS